MKETSSTRQWALVGSCVWGLVSWEKHRSHPVLSPTLLAWSAELPELRGGWRQQDFRRRTSMVNRVSQLLLLTAKLPGALSRTVSHPFLCGNSPSLVSRAGPPGADLGIFQPLHRGRQICLSSSLGNGAPLSGTVSCSAANLPHMHAGGIWGEGGE